MDSPATQPTPPLQPLCSTPWVTILLRVLSFLLSWMEQQWSLRDESNYSSTTHAPTSCLCSRYSAMTKTQLGLAWLLAELQRQEATAWDLALFSRYWTNAGAWVKPPFLDFFFFLAFLFPIWFQGYSTRTILWIRSSWVMIRFTHNTALTFA